MTAPTRRKRKKDQTPQGNPVLFKPPPSDTTNRKPTFDELGFDKAIVDAVGRDIWAALFDGHFRLAVKCRRCGRWLTHGTSKRNHLGPSCATKVIE